MNTIVLIPAYKPKPELISFVKKLSSFPVRKILIIDDGSGKDYRFIFSELKTIEKVEVLQHDTNRGKGSALKTGFRWAEQQHPKCTGVVTADADGQHKIEDIIRVAEALEKSPGKLIIGSRTFKGEIPFRSKLGNIVTALLFRFIYGIKLSDTQSGLRGIPRSLLRPFLDIPYNHYEYETEMLLLSSRLSLKIEEVPIETVYENNNESSHFNPLVDSFKIYFVLLRYTLASLASVSVDFIVFIAVYPLIGNVLFSIYTARGVSLFVNYGLNHRLVFNDKNHVKKTFPKYLTLVIVSGYFASLLISFTSVTFTLPIYLAKILSESILYIMNFIIQRKFIFKK